MALDIRQPVDRQIEALRDLVNSDGYALLCQEAERHYGPGARDRAMRSAMAKSTPMDDDVKKVFWVCEAIEQLLIWPEQEATRLATAVAEAEIESEQVGRRA